MNCDAIRSILDLHVEGRLSPRWRRRVEAHLSRCADCSRAAAALRPAAASSVAAPASLKEKLRRLASAPSQLKPLPRRSELPAALLSLALAGLLLCLLHAATPRVPSQRPVETPAAPVWRLP